ncbi:acyltransferase [uncultured Paraglaciecola sp.]|uniref:acyltransferase family protein n=1 Tax=uncultured Paraglaciecola sp. TaxID=1765024 RepID=UPI0030DB6339|tara:strand:- start:8120 stop:9256 length:1137 start_codon:yes stop_codon:yes gene_type:complete
MIFKNLHPSFKERVHITPELSNFLDMLRWIAALVVVVAHIRSTIMVPYSELVSSNLFLDIFYFVSNIGHEAVIVFFVLSGFLVGGNTLDSFINNKFSWRIYLVNRVSRLYVVLVPALIIGFALDYFGSYLYEPYYMNEYGFGPFAYDVTTRVNFDTFVMNLLMMQTSHSTQFGSNGPLWSLAYEFWYYITFPLILGLIYNKKTLSRFFSAVILVLLLIVLNTNIFIYFAYWLIGIIVYLLYKNKCESYSHLYISLLIFILLVYLSYINFFNVYKISLFFLAIATGYLIYSLQTSKILFSAFNVKMASFSYTLYLYHAPLLLYLASELGITKSQPEWSSFALFVFLLLCVYVYSYLAYLLFEKNTLNVRAFLHKVTSAK